MFRMKLIFRFRYLLPVFAVLFLFACAMPEKNFDQGLQAYEQEDYEAAQQEWGPLAEQGHAKAQYKLGDMYYHGEGVPQDYEKAVKWYRKAAEQEYILAQKKLGCLYVDDQGVAQDDMRAYKWFKIAAIQGDANMKSKLEKLAEDMNKEQIAEAKKHAQEWIKKHGD